MGRTICAPSVFYVCTVLFVLLVEDRLKFRDTSFLCARDPSLRLGELRQHSQLLFHFGEADKEEEDIVKVYLRIKPIKPSEADSGKLFTTIDDRKLFVNHARESTSSHNSDHHARRYSEQFIFTKILKEGVGQSQVFTECTLQPLKHFIQGENCLVFAYGTTNAGKTFTIRGDAANPGIIPRALDYVFTSLGDRVLDEPSLILVNGSRLEQLSDNGTAVLLNYKRIMLERGFNQHKHYDRKWTSTLSVNSDASCDDATQMFHDMEAKMRRDLPGDWSTSVSDDGAHYLVYVSFAEIYNENIYDLLKLSDPQHMCNWRQTPLQLGLDVTGNTYIKDLQHFQVTSGYEAYRIMLFGQHNLCIASTELNTVSSRSHCIFNIKLVKCTEDLNCTRISTFSFCDLAGSERAKKTHNRGDRMKESQNINTSLLVLGRCLNTIRTNQQKKEKMLVPFRDSKLTRLFKEPLRGNGSVSIIVNINMDPYLYDETINVLKFSAIAREVVLPPRCKKKPPPRMSLFAQHLQKRHQTISDSSMEGSTCSYTNVKNASSINNASLVKLVEQLHAELRQERSRNAALAQQLRIKEQECAAKDRSYSLREDKLREELVREFQESLNEVVTVSEATRESIECRLVDMANFRVRVTQKKYEDKLNRLKRQLKKRRYEDVEDIQEDDDHSDLRERLRNCEDQLASSMNEVQTLTAERDALRATVTSQSHEAKILQERVSRLELHLRVTSIPTLGGKCLVQNKVLDDLKQHLDEVIKQNASLEEKVKLLTATVDSASEDHEELLEEKNQLEKDCYSLEKQLVQKDVELAELMAKVDTYQATFSKQVQELELLKKVGHDRCEALKQKEAVIHNLELKLKEFSLSKQRKHSLGKLSNKIVVPWEANPIQPGTLTEDVKLLQIIQASEKGLTEKEELNNPSVQLLKAEDQPTLKCKDVAVLTEITGEQNKNSHHEIDDEYTVMKEQLQELHTENACLREALSKQEREVAEFRSKVSTLEANLSRQAEELKLLHKVGNDRLEALQQKDKHVNNLELRMEELSLADEKGQHLIQQLTNQNSVLMEKLASVEERQFPEVETLQKEIKELLQHTRTLEMSAREKDAELKKLQQDLKGEIITGMKYKEELEKLKRVYDHDMAVEKAVMKEQIEQLNMENVELRNSLSQLEMEMEKQKSQHESLFKVYDDRLRQKAEEIERHKRDAQHCQELLYKNTPTPNKEVKEFIKGLQAEVRKKDDQLMDLGRQMEKLKVRTVDTTILNEDVPADLVREVSPLHDHFEENRQPTKSTSKKGQKKKTPSTRVQHTKESGSSDSKIMLPGAKTKTRPRKQLFSQNDSFVEVGDEDKWEPLHSKEKGGRKKPKSPNTILKRSLRPKQ